MLYILAHLTLIVIVCCLTIQKTHLKIHVNTIVYRFQMLNINESDKN